MKIRCTSQSVAIILRRIPLTFIISLLSSVICVRAESPPVSEEVIDSLNRTSSDSTEKPVIFYKALADTDSLIHKSLFPHIIANSIYTRRIPYSIGDMLKTYSGFWNLRLGPFGQHSYLTYGGLPIYRFIIGDYLFDYVQFSLPVNGLIDSRLIPLAATERAYFDRLAGVCSNNALYLYHPPIPDSGSLTSAYMQKGDYGFSNTMVRFGSHAWNRAVFGFSAEFKKSNGYIFDSKKDLENFRLYTYYQLNDKYQLQPDIMFFSSDDQLRFLNEFYTDPMESKADFVGFSLGLKATEKMQLFNRIALVYQKFSETIRGKHPKYQQKVESYRLKIENGARLFGWEHFFTLEPFIKRVAFDPKRTTYMGISFKDNGNRDISSRLNLNISTSATISEIIDPNLSLSFGERYQLGGDLALYGQVYGTYESPRDFELFSGSPNYDIADPQGISRYYSFEGNSDLDNTLDLGYTLALETKRSGANLQLYFRHAFISDLYWWTQVPLSEDSIRYTPIPTDADLLMGGADISMTLPHDFDAEVAYSYSKLCARDNETCYTLSPRHNLYAALFKELYIEKYNLHCLLNLEGEYHSANYRDACNPVKLDDFMLMNFKLHLKIKQLTIFYNMDNLFNKTYRTYYDYKLRRAVWWGFLWNFYN